MHAELDAIAVIAADGEVLDDVAEALGEAVIDGLDGADALGGDLAVDRRFAPNASIARTDSLWAASCPSTSSVGSASA